MPSETEHRSNTAHSGGTLHVLLAEDEAINQLYVAEVVKMLGHQVEMALDGLEVLEKLKKGTFDLVFMDVRMPGMDGEEATRRIRAGEAGEKNTDIPIVALTAYAMVGDRERFIAAGMDDYVPKPIGPEELAEVLARVRKRSTTASNSRF
jgi:CheY-like chemotaxis protein